MADFERFSDESDESKNMRAANAELVESIYFGVDDNRGARFESNKVPDFDVARNELRSIASGLNRSTARVAELVDKSILDPMERIFKANNLLVES